MYGISEAVGCHLSRPMMAQSFSPSPKDVREIYDRLGRVVFRKIKKVKIFTDIGFPDVVKSHHPIAAPHEGHPAGRRILAGGVAVKYRPDKRAKEVIDAGVMTARKPLGP
jgi:hypothetical protein